MRAAEAAASAAAGRIATLERTVEQLRTDARTSQEQAGQLRQRLAASEETSRWMLPHLAGRLDEVADWAVSQPVRYVNEAPGGAWRVICYSTTVGQDARTLGAEVARSYRMPGNNPELVTALSAVHLGIDIAVPCGLILNELLTNAFKHAYPGPTKGLVELSVGPEAGDRCLIRVRDHGEGLSAAVEASPTTSLGLRLIRSLARQLDAEFAYLPCVKGTDARLVVPLEKG